MTRNELLERLMALDFMATDLALFLDTHPQNAQAIAAYNQILETANTVRERFEAEWGPLCSYRSQARDPNTFTWIDNPWPWEAEANPDGEGGCQ